jgi:hypothetical protein
MESSSSTSSLSLIIHDILQEEREKEKKKNDEEEILNNLISDFYDIPFDILDELFGFLPKEINKIIYDYTRSCCEVCENCCYLCRFYCCYCDCLRFDMLDICCRYEHTKLTKKFF